MNLSFGIILSFIAAFQFLFLALFLLTHNKGNRRNNKILGFIFLLFALSLGDFSLRASGISFPNLSLHLIDDGFFVLYGPLLYFYVLGIVYRDFTFRLSHFLHFIPYGFYLIFLVYLGFSIDAAGEEQLREKMQGADYSTWMIVFSIFLYAHVLTYLWFSYQTISVYHTVIKEKFSTLQGIHLDWLRFMIYTFTGITVISMIHNFMPVFGNVHFQYGSLIVLLLLSLLFVNRILFKALNQPEIFSGISLQESKKYASSSLQKAEIDRYSTQLIDAFEKEKLHLDPSLKIQDLASKLDTSPKALSQVINQHFGKSFYDFVNTYRCEEVKAILSQADRKTTILEAMYKAGFNSKSSFNKEFKKLTGQTPSEFRRGI
jgi:AraC-like DNA-binding protein